MSSSKRDFGSFHSSNVQELIHLSEEEYVPPHIPVSLPVFDSLVPFGNEMKKNHFILDDSWTFINHGAFGAALKQAMDAKLSWQKYVESQPLRFFDREMLPLQVYVIRELAKFIGCDPTGLVLVPNVTQGTNTVIQCLARRLSPGDRITTLSTNYGATRKLLKWISQEYKLLIDEIEIKFPLHSSQQVVRLIEETIQPETKLIILDHVSSNYAIILPIKEIVDVCHQKGIKVLVDGAHAPGALPLNVRETAADYYVGNAHKWLCCPKGCGFLYVEESLKDGIRPLIVSHGSNSGFHSEFSWIGLMDYSSYFALLTVLDFWNHYGPENIRAHIHSQAKEAAFLLTRAWGTNLLADISLFGSMIVVGLPDKVLGLQGEGLTYSDGERVQSTLYHRYKIEVPVKAIGGRLYVRISYHVYNKLEDYQVLADAVNELRKASPQAVPDKQNTHTSTTC